MDKSTMVPANEAAMEQEDWYMENGDYFCYTCGGLGFVVSCIDDICRGLGYCIHGDGMDDCPDCSNEWDLSCFPIDYDFEALEAGGEDGTK